MMCKYCEVDLYHGEQLPYDTKVDATKQHYEITILDDVEYEQFSLCIYGSKSELRIKINYCPLCGKRLGT